VRIFPTDSSRFEPPNRSADAVVGQASRLSGEASIGCESSASLAVPPDRQDACPTTGFGGRGRFSGRLSPGRTVTGGLLRRGGWGCLAGMKRKLGVAQGTVLRLLKQAEAAGGLDVAVDGDVRTPFGVR